MAYLHDFEAQAFQKLAVDTNNKFKAYKSTEIINSQFNQINNTFTKIPKNFEAAIGAERQVGTMTGKVTDSRPTTITKKVPGQDYCKAYIYDYATPTCIELEIWTQEIMGQQMKKTIKERIPVNIRKKYRSQNDHTWSANSKDWRDYKRKYGYDKRVMHQHDTRPDDALYPPHYLADTVANMGNKLTVIQTGENMFEIHGLDMEFQFNPYVWLHETGTSVFPARPFISPALQQATVDAVQVVSTRHPVERLRRKQIKAMKYEAGDIMFEAQYQAESRRSMQEMLMWIWWFMPQVDELRYLGIAHDVSKYMSGHFVEMDTIKHFMRSLAVGKAGQMTGMPISSKLARRTSRKALWGKQGVSIVGGS